MKRNALGISVLTVLIATGRSHGDIIYSNFQNITIPATYAGTYIDVDGGLAPSTSAFTGWDFNPFMGGMYLYNNSSFQPARAGTGGTNTVLKFTSGSTIDSSLNFATGSGGSLDHLGAQFTSGSEDYLGFKLNGNNYGSMRVVFTNNTSGAVIKDWAYDNSGASVKAGAIKQVGQDIIMSSGFTLGSSLVNSGGTTNLVKNSNETNILSSSTNSTITGTVSVNAGVLAVNGTLANVSTVTVANTGTLRGSGSIGSSLTIQTGGTLTAGNNGIESLATGTLTLNGNSTFAYKMDNDAVPGVSGDLTAVTGNLNFDLSTAANLTLSDLGSGSWNIGEKLTLLSYTGSWNNGLLKYLGSNISDDSTITYSGTDWLFNYNDIAAGSNYTSDLTGSSFVTMTAVPEPRTALLASLGLLVLLHRRRAASMVLPIDRPRLRPPLSRG